MLLWPSGSHKALGTILDFDIEVFDACLEWCISKFCWLLWEEKNIFLWGTAFQGWATDQQQIFWGSVEIVRHDSKKLPKLPTKRHLICLFFLDRQIKYICQCRACDVQCCNLSTAVRHQIVDTCSKFLLSFFAIKLFVFKIFLSHLTDCSLFTVMWL